jgi:hypothetical protein
MEPKVHYLVHKVRILRQTIQSILSHPITLRSILILSTHLRLGLPSRLFPSGFPTVVLVLLLLLVVVVVVALLVVVVIMLLSHRYIIIIIETASR